MGIIEILLIAVGLSLDAFAVSVGASSSGVINDARSKFRLSFHFGLFQFFMPVIGWFLGARIEPLVKDVDHWIAFALLLYVGGKMIIESFKKGNETEPKGNPSKGMTLVILSVATSIDALVVGFSLALINVEIWQPSVIIGIVTGILSLVGIYIGGFLGSRFGNKMEFIGGLVLIFIGIKILLSHIM
jgi:manganese efflux pump family protein